MAHHSNNNKYNRNNIRTASVDLRCVRLVQVKLQEQLSQLQQRASDFAKEQTEPEPPREPLRQLLSGRGQGGCEWVDLSWRPAFFGLVLASWRFVRSEAAIRCVICSRRAIRCDLFEARHPL